MTQTENYALPQFEGTDKFTKEDLNDGFQKIDTAISDLEDKVNVVSKEYIDQKLYEQNLKIASKVNAYLTQNISLRVVTKAEYDATPTKDPTTLYIIT